MEELKTVIKNVKDASIRDLGNINDRTKGLEKNKIWQALTNEENTIIVDKLDLSASREDKAAYLIGEHARDALKKMAGAKTTTITVTKRLKE